MGVRRWFAAVMVVVSTAGIVQLQTVGPAAAEVKLHTHWLEGFDSVVAPAFPAGWTTECVGCQAGDPGWVTVNFSGTSPNNRAFLRPKNHVTDNRLESAPFTYRPGAQLMFTHDWEFARPTGGQTQNRPDGGVVEIQIGGGSWTDIIAAGGSCSFAGCYNGAITSPANPLYRRNAFTGANPAIFAVTTLKLPASGVGQSVRMRWRVGTDANGAGDDGLMYWNIDDVRLQSEFLTVTVEQAAGQQDPTPTSPVNFTATFNDTVASLTGADIYLSDSTAADPGTLSAVVTGGPKIFNVAVSGMTRPGTVMASIPQRGTVGRPSADANYASTSVDNVVQYSPPTPTVTIEKAAGQADPTNAAPVTYTAVFSAPVTEFSGSDISFEGSTAAGALSATVTGGPSTYKVEVTGMTGPGAVVASIPANSVVWGNTASTSTDNSVDYDASRPAVTIAQASGQADPTGASPINFTATFSEAVTGFAGSDVTITGTAGGSKTATVTAAGGNAYTVAVSGMTTAGTVIVSIPANAATDAVGNASTASTSSDDSVTWAPDLPPSVTINQASGQADPTGTSPVNFTAAFNEPVTGFEGSDVSVTGTAGGSKTATVSPAGGNAYTVAVSGMTTPGTVIVAIPANAVVDGGNNGNTASTSNDDTVTWAPDLTAPTVIFNQAFGQDDPTGESPIKFTAAFSEPVTGFEGSDVIITGTAGGSKTATVRPSIGNEYTVEISGMTTPGTVIVSLPANAVTDGAGNTNTASTSSDNQVTWAPDLPPTVTVNQASGQADPTGAEPIRFTATFSEPVVGFDGTDLSFTGTAGGALAATVTPAGGNAYTIAVSGLTTPGTVIVEIPADSADDSGFNGNTASTSTDNSVTWNPGLTPTTVTINQASGQADPTSTSPIEFTATFNKVISGFDGSDVSITGTAGGAKTATVTSAGGNAYTVKVAGMTTGGTVIVAVPANAAVDGGNNGNTASTSSDNSVTWVPDTIAPTVTIDYPPYLADPTGTDPMYFLAIFSEAVNGFDGSDVSITGTAGGTKTATVRSIAPNTYAVAVSGMTTPGTVIVSIPANAVTDGNGNGNTASTSTDNSAVWDAGAPPTVTINQASGQADPTVTSPINFTATFSEPVADFDGVDVSITGTAGGSKTATVTPAGGNAYTVSVSGMTTPGTVAVSIPAEAAYDGDGNYNTASTSNDNTVTWGSAVTTAPAITSANATTFTVGQAATFTVTSTGSPTPTVSMSGTLPAGVTFTASANGTATLAGTPAAGAAASYPLTFTAANGVSPNATQSFALTVDAPPPPQADVSVAKTDSPDPVAAGSDITYTITVANSVAGSTAANVSLTDNIPANTTFVSRSLPGGWSCADQVAGSTSALSCTRPTLTPADGDQVFTLVVRVNLQIPSSTPVSNTATVSATGDMATFGNNVATATTTVTFAPSRPAVVRGSTNWLLRNSLTTGGHDTTFTYGTRPLTPFFGDWDGNGSKTAGTFEGGLFKLNNANDTSGPDLTFTFGDPRGFPVAGDFNGDGTDDVAVFRNGVWQVHHLGTGVPPDTTFSFGPALSWPSVVPVAGDWDGDGTDGIGAYNLLTGPAGTWSLRQTASGAGATRTVTYGGSGLYPVVGDWDGDGVDSLGTKVIAGGSWALANSNTTPSTSIAFDFGQDNDLPYGWR